MDCAQLMHRAAHDLLGAPRTPDHNLGEQFFQQEAERLLRLAPRLDLLSEECQAAFPAAFEDFFLTAPHVLQVNVSGEMLRFLATILPASALDALSPHILQRTHRPAPLQLAV